MGAEDATALIPDGAGLGQVRRAAQDCRACDLWKTGTQTVFGEVEGRPREDEARGVDVMFVGEQPGDQEDRQGRPFVGPAGRILDEGLEEAGIDRRKVYVTNAVKHFKWKPRGKRRIHQKPNAEELRSCRPWLEAELRLVQPQVLVCLGATAAQALLGRDFRITQRRGELVESPLAPVVTATVHPSSILRAPDEEARREQYSMFVDDLRTVASAIAGQGRPGHRPA
jgi:DNA polymerase